MPFNSKGHSLYQGSQTCRPQTGISLQTVGNRAVEMAGECVKFHLHMRRIWVGSRNPNPSHPLLLLPLLVHGARNIGDRCDIWLIFKVSFTYQSRQTSQSFDLTIIKLNYVQLLPLLVVLSEEKVIPI